MFRFLSMFFKILRLIACSSMPFMSISHSPLSEPCGVPYTDFSPGGGITSWIVGLEFEFGWSKSKFFACVTASGDVLVGLVRCSRSCSCLRSSSIFLSRASSAGCAGGGLGALIAPGSPGKHASYPPMAPTPPDEEQNRRRPTTPRSSYPPPC